MTSFAEVIGSPVGHSLSPVIHRFWLAQLGLEADYRATEVSSEALAGFIAGRAADPAWRGCNVTMPHKQAVAQLVADPGGVAASIGAMNTIARDEGGALIGTNTDPGGFIEPLLSRGWQGDRAIIVGAGGAARAMLFALQQVGVRQVSIVSRSPLKAMGLLAHFGLKGEVLAMDAPLPRADLLANASPMGMKGEAPYAPDLSALPPDAVVYDAVYAPLETPLLKAAAAHDLETIDGLEMLVGQAALAFGLFFGAEPPRDQDEALWEQLSGRA